MPQNYKKKLGIHGKKNYDEIYETKADIDADGF